MFHISRKQYIYNEEPHTALVVATRYKQIYDLKQSDIFEKVIQRNLSILKTESLISH